jgi:hypothetical protein
MSYHRDRLHPWLRSLLLPVKTLGSVQPLDRESESN